MNENVTYKRYYSSIIVVSIATLLLMGGVYTAHRVWSAPGEADKTEAQTVENKYTTFTGEVYDQISENYWEDIRADTLSNYYALAVNQVSGEEYELATTTRDAVLDVFKTAIDSVEGEERKVLFTKEVNALVVNTLEPRQRNKLFTQKQEQELRNIAKNVNPDKDLYKDLDLKKGASPEEVAEQYEKKNKELEEKERELEEKERQASTPEEQQQVTQKRQQVIKQQEQTKQAKDVLVNPNAKKRYDTYGAEPTIFTRSLSQDIFYLKIDRMAPTTLEEFEDAANSTLGQDELDTLILDLRGNIGGYIDILPYLLGPFVGKDNIAYNQYRHGDKVPVETKTGWLNSLIKFKRVVVLIDGRSKSSAEAMAASLKKFNAGVLVGETTQGWGTIENTYPIETQITPTEKHTLLLVNSLTLRPDGTPVEGRGVDPHINIKKDDWQKEFRSYYRDPDLLNYVTDLLTG